MANTLLTNHNDRDKFFAENPTVAGWFRLYTQDQIGFNCTISGTTLAERFDYPFNPDAFYEVYANSLVYSALKTSLTFNTVRYMFGSIVMEIYTLLKVGTKVDVDLATEIIESRCRLFSSKKA